MNKVKQFFFYCSGADSKLLTESPTEESKFVGIGATIFFTGLFASLAAGYAFFTVFDNIYAASLLGIFWGLMIFNLDRFIVSSMRKSSNKNAELTTAIPRVLLAILISIVIAKPLELKIFQKEINAELAIMAQEIYKTQEDVIKNKYVSEEEQIKASIDQLKNEIQVKTNERNDLALIAQQEADGTGGTGKRNAGPIYRIKKADADRANEELKAVENVNNQRIADYYTKLSELDANKSSELDQLIQGDIGGPAARLEALDRLTIKSSAIWWANAFIILLFIIVETAPIFVKIISKKGPYDYLLETSEYEYEVNGLKNKAFIHAEIKRESKDLSMKEKKFVDDRLDVKLDQI